MNNTARMSVISHFSNITDPRLHRTKKHPLINIIFISLTALLCGCETWAEVEVFGKSQKPYLLKYIDLSNGIPSHDTFGRVFALLDMDKFQESFLSWTNDICNNTKGKIVAFDGKTLRRSGDKIKGKKAIHMVSAWVVENNIVLSQTKVEDKTNEITALKNLFEILNLKKSIITIDAMGCQKDIARIITGKKADYVLALKSNHKTLHKDVINTFKLKNAPIESTYQTNEKNRNRLEKRTYSLVTNKEDLNFINQNNKWTNLKGIVEVKSKRQIIGEEPKLETRYYITSLTNIKHISNAIRSHWGIENKLHRSLDVSFREDDSRARNGNSAANLSTLRRITINLIRQDKSKGSIKVKRTKAAFDTKFRDKLLFQGN